MRITTTKLVLFALIGIFAAQIAFYYPVLGETVATHFDTFGRPNGIMSKQSFLIFEIALLILIVGEALLIPFVVQKLPVSVINIPNRDHWLAEERRAGTFDGIRTMFEALGVVMVAFFIAVNQIVFRANVMRENLPTWMFLTVFAVFVAAMIVWLVRFVRRFRIPAPKPPEGSVNTDES